MNLIIGTIIPIGYNFDSAKIKNFVLCDGSAISRTTYAELFKAIGRSWGEGDGSKTFNIPDLRGVFLRGVDDGAGNDPNADDRSPIYKGGNAGDSVGSYQEYATALPTSKNVKTSIPLGPNIDNGNHVHNVPHRPTESSWYEIAGSHYAAWNSGGKNSSEAGLHLHTVCSGGDSETRPVNLYLNYLIYTGPIVG